MPCECRIVTTYHPMGNTMVPEETVIQCASCQEQDSQDALVPDPEMFRCAQCNQRFFDRDIVPLDGLPFCSEHCGQQHQLEAEWPEIPKLEKVPYCQLPGTGERR